MATSTEQINDLIGAYTDLKGFFEGAKSGIEEALSAAASRYQNFFSTVYVDQASGNDANNGTPEAPVASIQRALDLSPFFGFISVRVRGNYTTTERIRPRGRMFSVVGCVAGSDWVTASDPAQRPRLNIGYYDRDGKAEVAGFESGYDAFIDISYLDIQLPSLANVVAALPESGTEDVRAGSLFSVVSSARGRTGSVRFRYGELIVPADYYSVLFDASIGWYFSTVAMTIDGDIAGKVHPMVPAAADANAYTRYIQTTMATL